MMKEPKYKLDRVAIRLVKDPPLITKQPITCADDAIKLVGSELLQMDREYCYAINVNTAGRPISCSIVSVGTLDSAIVSSREVFKQAVLSNAAGIIMLHNHPSGKVDPSSDDLKLTQKLKEAGEILGIRMIDHIIVGSDGYYSIESGEKRTCEGGILPQDPQTVLLGEEKAPYGMAEKVKALTSDLEQGVKDLFSSEKYREYLDVMSRFYSYSPSNCLLIAMQRPDATHVAGYRAWQQNFGRFVKRDETALKILAPCPYKQEVDVTKKDADGIDRTEKELVDRIGFRISYVFDVSQTDGKPLPEIASTLTGSVQDYTKIREAVEQISPVPVRYAPILSSAKGYFSAAEKEIVVKDNMSNEQTLKTLVHEVAHAMLHDPDANKDRTELPGRRTKEVEAESVAYTVCRYLGIDTADYSFGYVAGWSAGKELKELKGSLQTIRDASSRIISRLEPVLRPELAAVRDQTMLTEKRQHKARCI